MRIWVGSVVGVVLACGGVSAGGFDEHAEPPDPCIELPVSAFDAIEDDGIASQMLAQWGAVRAMKDCVPRAFFDRVTGERLTDDEILRRVFNGSSPRVEVVPLPGSLGFLLVAGCAFALIRSVRERT